MDAHLQYLSGLINQAFARMKGKNPVRRTQYIDASKGIWSFGNSFVY